MRKRQILSLAIIVLLIITNTLTSQTKKGTWLAEGNLGNINLSNNKNESTTGTNISKSETQGYYISLFPRVGYFLNDNFALGSTLNFSYQYNKYKSFWNNGMKCYDGVNSNSSFGLSPFLRYYYTKNTKNRLYGQLGGGINIDIFNNNAATMFYENGDISGTYKNPSKGKVVSGEVLIGFNHFFNANIAFNSSIGYSYGKRTQNNSNYSIEGGITRGPFNQTKSTNITGNVIWNFGFTIIIAGKKN